MSEQRDEARSEAVTTGNARHPYVRPVLEALGNWSVLTLQQSVGISYFRDPSLEDDTRSRYGDV